ncbi:hypothetical protein B0G75_116122 [Paraburkholderia sp. BL18I3N2]|nr:hypothetical protein B0G75_116122 [Paraburkholderia sp. BL18I3N2]
MRAIESPSCGYAWLLLGRDAVVGRAQSRHQAAVMRLSRGLQPVFTPSSRVHNIHQAATAGRLYARNNNPATITAATAYTASTAASGTSCA